MFSLQTKFITYLYNLVIWGAGSLKTNFPEENSFLLTAILINLLFNIKYYVFPVNFINYRRKNKIRNNKYRQNL